jgi:restriction endonuclease S subunit
MVLDFTDIDKIVEDRRLDPIYFGLDFLNKQIRFPFVPLKSFCIDFQSGFGAGKEDQATKEDGIIQIRPTNIDNEGMLKYDKNIFVPATLNKALLDIDDVLFNNTNSQELVGKTAILKEKKELFFSNHITRIKVNKEKALPDYLWIILNIYQRKNIFYSICTNWNNQSGVGVELLRSLKVPLPPKDIQQQIVALYNQAVEEKQAKEQEAKDLLTSIDEYLLRELEIELPENVSNERYFEVNIWDLIGGRLDPTPYSGKYKSLQKMVENSSLSKKHLRNLITQSIAGDWGLDEAEVESKDYTKCLVIRSTEFDNRYNLNLDNSRVKYRNIKTEKLNKMNIQADDLLIEKSGGSPDQPVGRIAFLTQEVVNNNTLCCSNFIHKVRVDNSEVIPEYVYFYLKTMYNIGVTESMQSQTNGIRNLIMNEYFKQIILLPDKDKQKQLVYNIKTMQTQAKQLQEEAIEVLEKAKREVERIIE